MVKVSKRPMTELEKTYASAPTRQVGQWQNLLKQVVDTGQGVEVADLSKAQVWGLIRAARAKGLRAKPLDKGTRVIVLPAIKE